MFRWFKKKDKLIANNMELNKTKQTAGEMHSDRWFYGVID